MTDKSEIVSKVIDIFSEVFKEEREALHLSSEIETLKNFDSLEKLNLFLRIEQELSVNFEMKEMLEMKTIGDVVEGIYQK